MKFPSILIFIVVALFVQCDSSNEYRSELLKPIAKKDYGELLFAMERKYWKSNLGKVIENSFERLVKTTPLPYENEFNIDFIVPNKLLKNLKSKNCILFIEIEDYFPKETTPIYKRDLWAKGQIVIELKFKSEKIAINYIKNNTNNLKKSINQFYFEMISKTFYKENIINSSLEKSIDFRYLASKKFKLNKRDNNFWWFSELEITKDQNGSHEVQKGIFIYKYPYNSKEQFEKTHQIRIRDSICRKYLRGKNKTSFMITLLDGLNETNTETSIIKNKFCHELSGCWKMENDKMGGPFVSVSRLSEDKKYIITSAGYVYAPNFKKLALIREVKTILYSTFN